MSYGKKMDSIVYLFNGAFVIKERAALKFLESSSVTTGVMHV